MSVRRPDQLQPLPSQPVPTDAFIICLCTGRWYSPAGSSRNETLTLASRQHPAAITKDCSTCPRNSSPSGFSSLQPLSMGFSIRRCHASPLPQRLAERIESANVSKQRESAVGGGGRSAPNEKLTPKSSTSGVIARENLKTQVNRPADAISGLKAIHQRERRARDSNPLRNAT